MDFLSNRRTALLTCLLVGLAVSSDESRACKDLNWTLEEKVLASDTVVLGRISGLRVPEMEELAKGTLEENVAISSALHGIDIRLVVTFPMRKGRLGTMEIPLDQCAQGRYNDLRIGMRVVAMRMGSRWVLLTRAEDIARAANALGTTLPTPYVEKPPTKENES